MLLEQGKRLLSVISYAHNLMPNVVEDDEAWINQWGAVSEHGIDLLIPVETSLGFNHIMPGPKFSPRLYPGKMIFTISGRHHHRLQMDIDKLYWTAKTIVAVQLQVKSNVQHRRSELLS